MNCGYVLGRDGRCAFTYDPSGDSEIAHNIGLRHVRSKLKSVKSSSLNAVTSTAGVSRFFLKLLEGTGGI